MSRTPARSKSTAADARTPTGGLEALAALGAGARARLARSPGFLASLDDASVKACLESELPEVLGTWPEKP